MFRRTVTMIVGLLLTVVMLPATFHVRAEAAEDQHSWQNFTDELFKELDVLDFKQVFHRRCVGMAVTPVGEVFVLVHKKGLCRSKDQGKTWKTQPLNELGGRGQTGACFSLSYPYDGRMALFTIDGQGGITGDGGDTWRAFGRHHRGFDYGDVDWTATDSKTIFALEHEPFNRCLSIDGGATWKRLDEEADKESGDRAGPNDRLAVVDARTLLLGDCRKDRISLSTDLGKTWTEVAQYRPLGSRPVHYGKKLYWATSAGVIVSDDGRKWSLVGKGLENATFGPYFGRSDAEMMVVSDKGFFLTRDGAQTWTHAAPLHLVDDGFTKNFSKIGLFWYFGWDSVENILYSSGLGGSCSYLRLNRKP